MSWLISLFTSGVLGSILNPIFDWLKNKDNTALGVDTNSAAVEVAAIKAAAEIQTGMFSHRIYWVVWLLGAGPVMLYHAMIYLVSTFPDFFFWLTAIEASKAILAVPAAEQAFGQVVVYSVFGMHVLDSIVSKRK